MTLPVTDALLDQQKKDYQTVIAACKAVPKCIGMTVWDYTDKVGTFQLHILMCAYLITSIPGFLEFLVVKGLRSPGMRY